MNNAIKFNGSEYVVDTADETITVYANTPWIDPEHEYACALPLHIERAMGRVHVCLAYGDVAIQLVTHMGEPLPHDETPEQHRTLISAARNEAERCLDEWHAWCREQATE